MDGSTHKYPDILEDIFFVDANNGWAVGEMVSSYTPQTAVILGIFKRAVQRKDIECQIADSAVGWTVGGDFGVSIILHTTNGGETWEDKASRKMRHLLLAKQQLI